MLVHVKELQVGCTARATAAIDALEAVRHPAWKMARFGLSENAEKQDFEDYVLGLLYETT